jgi:hypothetical protein
MRHLLVTHPKMRFVSSLHRDADHIEVPARTPRLLAPTSHERPLLGPRALPFVRPAVAVYSSVPRRIREATEK